MLNLALLESLGVHQIVSSCQLEPSGEGFVLFDVNEKKDRRRINPFYHFVISVTAIMERSRTYIGSIEGYLCKLHANYGTKRKKLNIEDLAFKYENIPVSDLTISILNEKDETFPRQWSTGREWCREGHFFALIYKADIDKEFKNTFIEWYLAINLHEVLQSECGIHIDSVFLPEGVMVKKTGRHLRKEGFSRIGGEEGSYFARHSPIALATPPSAMSEKERVRVRKKQVLDGQFSI